MGIYPALLIGAALINATSAGFTLAQSPRQRATQLSSLVMLGAAWWAICEVFWNSAATADIAMVWMRLSAPGWALIPGLLPHVIERHIETFGRPSPSMRRTRRRLRWAAAWGYSSGAAVTALSLLGWGVHGELQRVAWGWNYAPGPAQMAFFVAIVPPLFVAMRVILWGSRSPLSVTPRVHRLSIIAGSSTPLVLVTLTSVALPIAGIHFPRLGSFGYATLSMIILITGYRYGLSFFTPQQFSAEILETLHEGVVMTTESGIIRRVNRGFVELSGRTAAALVGADLRDLLAWEAPSQLTAVEEVRGSLLDQDSHAIPVAVSSTSLSDEGGNMIGVVVVVRDLRELEDLRLQMLTQARLAAVGELAAGLAHEMNNPLAYVRSNLGQLERHWKSLWEVQALPQEERDAIVDETREIIDESVAGVDRAAEIVRGVRRFTHAGSPMRELADLNELIQDTLAMVRPQVQSTELDLRFVPGPLPSVLCASQELRQVFLNLLVNAIHAVEGHGRVMVESSVRGGEVVVEVSDDGCGIAPHDLERIFDPFFTTKPVGEGTGLGLALTWQIVDAHGGRITVESTPAQGSTLRVFLPAAESAAQ